ncbi:hypothetical protein PCASD_14219 [Puccinia coronata f. sp. avenae]|uniref:Uncharacterized protein n=1 Tax=Puccinia coronata f. sp. avenae TaxID=200324 RepID=A0A2N5TNZ9_9BASI|nr:hypothetical protein PCASD_14219 [Puccinia coronata f. sp. avenae]
MATGLCGVFSPHHSPYTIRLSKKTNYPICLTTSILVSLNGSKDFFSEATDFLQLSNALLVMNMNLGNHSEISSQVRNLANVYSIFTAEVEKLDLAGIHVIKLILQEYFKFFYLEKNSKNQAFKLLAKTLNDDVENLLANANKTLELADNLFAEHDKTSILFHQEISILENMQHRRGN